MTDFGVIIEQAGDGSWSAGAADMPVFSCGDTLDEVRVGIREAIALYLDELDREGLPQPEPRSIVETVRL